MHTERTRRRIAQEQRLTHYDERQARSTIGLWDGTRKPFGLSSVGRVLEGRARVVMV